MDELRRENGRLRQENQELRELLKQITERLVAAEEIIKQLRERLGQNSHNSNWPSRRDKKQKIHLSKLETRKTQEAAYQAMQTRLGQRLIQIACQRSELHHIPFKLGLAVLLNGSLLAGGWALWQYRNRPLLPVTILLFLLWALRYKNAGLIQLVLGMFGLGLGYGYGSRFSPHKQPRADSDYDLGVLAAHPVRLHHKRDPRILLARAILMVLTWQKVDLKQYPLSHFQEKDGVLLLALFLGRLLSPLIALLAWGKGLSGR